MSGGGAEQIRFGSGAGSERFAVRYRGGMHRYVLCNYLRSIRRFFSWIVLLGGKISIILPHETSESKNFACVEKACRDGE